MRDGEFTALAFWPQITLRDGESETGVVLHMVSALAVAGRIGLTAIGDTLEEARRASYAVKAAAGVAAA
jgi:hypothetical protein